MRFFKIILSCTLYLLIVSGIQSEAKGSCPDGYNQTFKQMTIGDCDYIVEICYKCYFVSYEAAVVITSIKMEIPPPPEEPCEQDPPMSWAEIVDEVYDVVHQPGYIIDILCEGEHPPCPNEGYEVIIDHNICWRKYNDNGLINLVSCPTETGVCRSTYFFCWDYVLGVWQHNLIDGPDEEGDVDCTTTEPDDPTNGNYSTCFRLGNTPCD